MFPTARGRKLKDFKGFTVKVKNKMNKSVFFCIFVFFCTILYSVNFLYFFLFYFSKILYYFDTVTL